MWYENNGTLVFVEFENELEFLRQNPQAVEIKNLNYWLESHEVLFSEKMDEN